MILEFSVGNFGPYNETATLSMQATAFNDNEDAVIKDQGSKYRVLTSATIFGPNASGKSYLFKALIALKTVIGKKRTQHEPISPYVPFHANLKNMDKPTEFRMMMLIDNIRYDYFISYTRNRIESETLVYYPNNYPVDVFKRTGGNSQNSLIESDKLTDTTSYLLFASEFNDDICNRVFKEITDIEVIGDYPVLLEYSLSMLYADPELKPLVLDAMDAADLGLQDMDLTRSTVPVMSQTGGGIERRELFSAYVTHHFEQDDGSFCDMTLPLNQESNGTKEMLSIMVPIANCLKRGGVVFIDEFGSNLHHELTRWILNLFNSELNRNRAQLIVNTHDLGLMDIDEVQRRDQIMFVNKSRSTGASELYRLTDFRGTTKKTNVLRNYLEGRYGATPSTIRRDIL